MLSMLEHGILEMLITMTEEVTWRFPETFLSDLWWALGSGFSAWPPRFPVPVPWSTAPLSRGVSFPCWHPLDTHHIAHGARSEIKDK